MSAEHEFVSEIEQELIEATHFTPEKKYRKRQDYLGALLRAVCEDLTDEDFDKLSEEAADWTNDAVAAHKQDEPLPDFVNGEDHEPHSIEAEEASVADAAQHETDEDDEKGLGSTKHETQEKEKYEGPNYLPKKPKKGRPKGSTNKAKVAKEAKEPKVKKKTGPKREARGLNPWGVANGTKSDHVCRMLAQEGGTTMRDISEYAGAPMYNLIGRLARHGHKIIKNGLNLKMYHKDSKNEV